MLYYPAILYRADKNGVFGVTVPDLLINASGPTADEALKDAADIMDEITAEMATEGEPYPEPTPVDEIDLRGGTLVLLPAPLHKVAA